MTYVVRYVRHTYIVLLKDPLIARLALARHYVPVNKLVSKVTLITLYNSSSLSPKY